MATSANITYYIVKDKNGRIVGEYRQNCLCKDVKTEKLKLHVPYEDFTIILRWPDENEVDHFTEEISLKDYLNGAKVNKVKWKKEV